MNKFLVSAITAATVFTAIVPVATAATVSGAFNVSVTLLSQCISTSATPAIAFGNYTAFGAAITNVALSAPLTFKCTSGMPAPTVAFDAGGAGGILAGLAYTLTTPVLTRTNGTAATATTAATQDTYSYTFTGSIAAGQSGECVTASGTSCAPTAARTIVVTY